QKLAGLTWEFESILRIGSQESMDIVLRDPSVSRRQAEIQNAGNKWVVRDLAQNPRYLTYLNGMALGRGDYRLQPHDVLKCGSLALRITTLEENLPEATAPPPQLLGGNGEPA